MPVETTGAVTPTKAAPAPSSEVEDYARYRLTIEAMGRGRFVYKTVDRITGEVVRQLPREDVQKMLEDPRYAGGDVIDTTV